MPRFGKRLVGAFLALGLCCGIPLLLLDRLSSFGEEVVARVPSPDGRKAAVVVELDGGATTSLGYSVRVDGDEVAMAYAATVSEGYGVKVSWLDARTIEIAFDHARFVRRGDVGDLRVVVRGQVDL